MPKIDLGATSSAVAEPRGKRWVEVPEKDIFEYPHPIVRINMLEFGPGKHFVDALLADTIEDRVRAKYQADLRVMQRNPDLNAQGIMTRFGAGRGGHFVANPDSLQ
jgi:hypothetical protein